jgi:hypothetical protein
MPAVNVKQVAIYLTPAQKTTLDRLHTVTRIPRTVLMVEALTDLFAKYAHLLREPKAKPRAKR